MYFSIYLNDQYQMAGMWDVIGVELVELVVIWLSQFINAKFAKNSITNQSFCTPLMFHLLIVILIVIDNFTKYEWMNEC